MTRSCQYVNGIIVIPNMLGELEYQSEVYMFNQIYSVIPVENAEVFSVNIFLTFEMSIHCSNCLSCRSIFYPYPSNWIYLYDCLKWLKRGKKIPQGHTGNTSCWKYFYRYVIKGRKHPAGFQAISCQMGHKTIFNSQNCAVFLVVL